MLVVLIVDDIAFGPMEFEQAALRMYDAKAKDLLAFIAPLYPAEGVDGFIKTPRQHTEKYAKRAELRIITGFGSVPDKPESNPQGGKKEPDGDEP